MRKQLQLLPRFKDEDEEREVWATHESIDYIDWSQAEELAFPNLKPSKQFFSNKD